MCSKSKAKSPRCINKGGLIPEIRWANKSILRRPLVIGDSTRCSAIGEGRAEGDLKGGASVIRFVCSKEYAHTAAVRYRPSTRGPIAESRRERRSVLVDCGRRYRTSCAASLRDGEPHGAAGASSDNAGGVEIARSAYAAVVRKDHSGGIRPRSEALTTSSGSDAGCPHRGSQNRGCPRQALLRNQGYRRRVCRYSQGGMFPGLGTNDTANDHYWRRVQPVNATLLVVYRQAFQSPRSSWGVG